jgi:hypothetical protein
MKPLSHIVAGIIVLLFGTTLGIAVSQTQWVSDIRVSKNDIVHLQKMDAKLSDEITNMRIDTNERFKNLTQSVDRLIASNTELVSVIRAQQDVLSKRP